MPSPSPQTDNILGGHQTQQHRESMLFRPASTANHTFPSKKLTEPRTQAESECLPQDLQTLCLSSTWDRHDRTVDKTLPCSHRTQPCTRRKTVRREVGFVVMCSIAVAVAVHLMTFCSERGREMLRADLAVAARILSTVQTGHVMPNFPSVSAVWLSRPSDPRPRLRDSAIPESAWIVVAPQSRNHAPDFPTTLPL